MASTDSPGSRGSGTSVPAIVLGIVGIIGGLFIPIIGIVLGIIGLVLVRRQGGPVDRNGTILCIAAIAVSVVNWIATVILFAA